METNYEIRVKGVLDCSWSEYFMPLILTPQGDETHITGLVQDQAELFGILLKIRDLGLHLISVNTIPIIGEKA